METLAHQICAEDSDASPADVRRDGPALRHLSIGGNVWRHASSRQDCGAGALPRGVARSFATSRTSKTGSARRSSPTAVATLVRSASMATVPLRCWALTQVNDTANAPTANEPTLRCHVICSSNPAVQDAAIAHSGPTADPPAACCPPGPRRHGKPARHECQSWEINRLKLVRNVL